MQIKVAMLDDDVNALPIIAGAANSAFRAKGMSPEITCFRSGKALLKALETTAFQLVMLDIEMPDMDGIAVGKSIRERGMEVPIVYVSECENRVFDSFQVRPLGFVRKSNFLNDIAAVTELYLKTCAQESTGEYLEFQTRSGLLTLKSKQIRYIEGSRNYQLLYTVSGKEPIEVKMTMDKLEAMTEPPTMTPRCWNWGSLFWVSATVPSSPPGWAAAPLSPRRPPSTERSIFTWIFPSPS